ncbi:MAG: acyl-CoA dehydrogenase, partial [Rhodobacterales bacterium]
MPYPAPVAALRVLLSHVAGFSRVAATARFADANDDTVGAILSGAARLCQEVLAPLQRVGDTHP